MQDLRTQLRKAAQLALRRRGYTVNVVSVGGVAPGARLTATQGHKTLAIAVRTSQKREVGLVPQDAGGWKTVSQVDRMIAAVPSKSRNQIEIICFESEKLINAFDDYVRRQARITEPGVPVFISLDESKGSGSTKFALKKLALWRDELNMDELGRQAKTERFEQFIERVTREFADLVGVNHKRIIVDFRISSNLGDE